MNYEIHIQDVDNSQEELILHHASRGGIELSWLGGNDPTQSIVGSELKFTIEASNGKDMRYKEFFTSNEKKWLVSLIESETSQIVWKGYLLPENYSEPYEYPVFYVDLTATDGIGLLKGKYFPTEFYRKERTIAELICSSLKMTGISFDVWLHPATRNLFKMRWHEVFLNPELSFDEKDAPSVYDMLNDVISSMQCQLYQSSGRWTIEGVNVKGYTAVDDSEEIHGGIEDYLGGYLFPLIYDVYDIHGSFKFSKAKKKNVKAIRFLGKPMIDLIPPKKRVEVTHKTKEMALPEGVYRYADAPWEVNENQPNNFYLSRYWKYKLSPNYFPTEAQFMPAHQTDDDYLIVSVGPPPFTDSVKFELMEKPFLQQGWKMELVMEFELILTSDKRPDDDTIAKWSNIPVFRVSVGDDMLFYNLNFSMKDTINVTFDSQGKGSAEMNFFVKKSGFLNIELFRPSIDQTENEVQVSGYFLKKLELRNRFEEGKEFYTAEIEDDATQVDEFELKYSDDPTSMSPSFYLEKLKVYDNDTLNPALMQVYNVFQMDGKWYADLPLVTAAMVDQYADVANPIFKLVNPDQSQEIEFDRPAVLWNYAGGEMHLIEVPGHVDEARLLIPKMDIKGPDIPRENWLQWIDVLLPNKIDRLGQLIADLRKNISAKEAVEITGVADQPIKYDDILLFEYADLTRVFIPTILTWNIDENESSVTMREFVYTNQNVLGFPSYIDAGEIMKIEENQTDVSPNNPVIFAPSFDPITTYWQFIVGHGTIENSDTMAPTFKNLSDDYYVVELVAVDVLGNVIKDQVEIVRKIERTCFVSWNHSNDENIIINSLGDQDSGDLQLLDGDNMVSELPDRAFINLDFKIEMSADISVYQYTQVFEVIKNENKIYRFDLSVEENKLNAHKNKEFSFKLSYRRGDLIQFNYSSFRNGSEDPRANIFGWIRFRLTGYEIVDGYIELTNVPRTVDIRHVQDQ